MKLPKLSTRRVAGRVYYVTKIAGKQHHLGADPEVAKRAYKELLFSGSDKAKERGPKESFGYLAPMAQAFLESIERRRSAATYADYRRYLVDFLEHAPPRMLAHDLKRIHVLDWLDEHPTWGPAARGNAISVLKACFNWHVERETLPVNPIAAMKRPARPRRETVLTQEMRALALARIQNQAFRDFYFLLCELLIRPFELRTLQARQIDFGRGIAIFGRTEHKTGEKTGRERLVYLTPAATAILSEMAKRHPDGAILRNSRGEAWTKGAIVTSFRRLRDRVPGLPRNHTAYCERHTSITVGLERGLSDSVIAELAGHADATMVAKVYGHLRSRPLTMAKAAADAASGLSVYVPPSDDQDGGQGHARSG